MANNPDHKPFSVCSYESQLGHALQALCYGSPKCVSASLYQKDGVIIASAGDFKKVSKFEATYHKFTEVGFILILYFFV